MNQKDTRHAPRGAASGASAAAQWLDAFRREAPAQLLPMLREMFALARQDIDRRVREDPGAATLYEDEFTNLGILQGDLLLYERRWQQRINAGFDDWPRQPAPLDVYSILSDEDLQSQLVGQPVIEALERRFSDAIDLIDSRLRSVATALGTAQRPANPVAPRALVESLLLSIPAGECVPELRQRLLRLFERIAGQRLTEFYAAMNTGLAEAGYALQSDSGYGILPLPGKDMLAHEHERTWTGDETVEAGTSWRRSVKHAERDSTIDTLRGEMLRRWARMQHPLPDEEDARRELRDKEFLAVLSLLQGDPDNVPDTTPRPAGIAGQLREQVLAGAASLGIDAGSVRLSFDQEDAIALGGALFDRLVAGHVLAADTAGHFARLAYPVVRAVLTQPVFFDTPSHAVRQLLPEILWAWDANLRDRPEETAAHAAAARAVDAVVDDFHGNDRVFSDALQALRAELEPLRARAETARRRTVQTVEGRDRLQRARAMADAALRARIEDRPLLRCVSAFLDEQWRHALIHAWLREGSDAPRYRKTLALGDALVALDALAAHAQGGAVAEELLRIEPPLRESLEVSGLGGEGADELLAMLVRDIARPDAQRTVATFEPLADPAETSASADADPDATLPLQVEQWLAWRDDDGGVRRLQVAWINPHGRCVLVNRAGQRVTLQEEVDVRTLVDGGKVRPLPPQGPVEAVLEDWEAQARAGWLP